MHSKEDYVYFYQTSLFVNEYWSLPAGVDFRENQRVINLTFPSKGVYVDIIRLDFKEHPCTA
jgi:hypothetical protein